MRKSFISLASKAFKPVASAILTRRHTQQQCQAMQLRLQYSFAFQNKSYDLMKQLNDIEKKFQAAAKSKNYEGCVTLLIEKINIKKSSPNTSLLNDYRMIGELYQHLGKANEALNSYEEALKLAIKLDSKEIQAFSLSDIAGIHYLSENYQQAAGYFEESINILREIKSPNNKEIAMGLLNLGETLVKNQDGNKALIVYKEAKDAYTALLSNTELSEEDNFEYQRNKGLVCDAIGSLSLQKGNLELALKELQTALGIYGELFGMEDSILVGTLTNLAILFQQMRKEEDALKIYERALKIAEKNSDKVQLHEQLSLILGCAKAYNNLRRFKDAVKMFDKLEKATNDAQKNNNQMIPMIKGHKGYLLIQLGEYDKAKSEILEGLNILSNIEMNIHKAILQTQLSYILLFREQQYQQSLDLATESYQFISKLNQEDSNCGDCLRIMGLANQNLGQKEKAKEYLGKSLDILLKSVERAEDAEKVRQEFNNLN